MNCAAKTAKYVLFVVNSLISMASVHLILLGILYQTDNTLYFLGNQDHLVPLSIFCIIVGGITLLISFLGCCGAVKEISTMLVLYAVILVALLIAKVAFMVYFWLTVKAKNFGDYNVMMKVHLEGVMQSYNMSTVSQHYIDALQINFECCGVSSASEWTTLPQSCCGRISSQILQERCMVSKFLVGCGDILGEWVKTHVVVLFLLGLATCAVEGVSASIALCLQNNIRHVPPKELMRYTMLQQKVEDSEM